MGDRTEVPRALAARAMREHGAVLARVCMALLGDSASAERALERVAREASGTRLDEGKEALRLMGLARGACTTQLSKLPMRTEAPRHEGAASPIGDHGLEREPEPAAARAALGRLKPTEREAVVLHIVGGLDVAGVAEACAVDVATARTRIARGVAQLASEDEHR